jgi:hypothetical protein
VYLSDRVVPKVASSFNTLAPGVEALPQLYWATAADDAAIRAVIAIAGIESFIGNLRDAQSTHRATWEVLRSIKRGFGASIPSEHTLHRNFIRRQSKVRKISIKLDAAPLGISVPHTMLASADEVIE